MEIILSDFTQSNIEKSFQNDLLVSPLIQALEPNLVKGGQRAVLGEIRTFGGRKYIKSAEGWKFYGAGTGEKAKAHSAKHTGHEATGIKRVDKTPEGIDHNQKYRDVLSASRAGNHYEAAHHFGKMDADHPLSRSLAMDSNLRDNYATLKLAKNATKSKNDDHIDAADEKIREKHGDIVADNFGDSIDNLDKGKDVATFLDAQVKANPKPKYSPQQLQAMSQDVEVTAKLHKLINDEGVKTHQGAFDSIAIHQKNHKSALGILARQGYTSTMDGTDDHIDGPIDVFKNNKTGHRVSIQKVSNDKIDAAVDRVVSSGKTSLEDDTKDIDRQYLSDFYHDRAVDLDKEGRSVEADELYTLSKKYNTTSSQAASKKSKFDNVSDEDLYKQFQSSPRGSSQRDALHKVLRERKVL